MKPANIEELQEIIRSETRLKPSAGKSKTALAGPADGVDLDLSGLAGLLEYQPSEFTFTALAGTRLAEVKQALVQHGQYLPFDPPFVERGATLGGTVAAGLSGSMRYRFGGVRDFILAVQFIDGQGYPVRSGGKVVKNSAGFDLPKMMVGSLGMFGALVELTFKVFPRPPAFITFRAEFQELSEALQALTRLMTAPVDLYALDLIPGEQGVELLARLGGLPEAFPERIERLKKLAGSGEALEGEIETGLWLAAREFTWLSEGSTLLRVPLTPRRVQEFDRFLSENGAQRRYTVGANLAWIAWPGPVEALDRRLLEWELAGLLVLGPAGRARIGFRPGEAFTRRIKSALDPAGRWVEI